VFEKPDGHDPLRPALQPENAKVAWQHIPGAWGEGLSLVDVLAPLGMALAGRYGELTNIRWETDDLLSSVPYLGRIVRQLRLRVRCEGQCRRVMSTRWAYVPRRHCKGRTGFVRLAIFNLVNIWGSDGQVGPPLAVLLLSILAHLC